MRPRTSSGQRSEQPGQFRLASDEQQPRARLVELREGSQQQVHAFARDHLPAKEKDDTVLARGARAARRNGARSQ